MWPAIGNVRRAGRAGDTTSPCSPFKLRPLLSREPERVGQFVDGVGVGAVPQSALQITDAAAGQPRSLGQHLLGDDSPRLKPGASGMALVCRPTPLVRFHPVERTFRTDSTLGWHLFTDGAACTRRND